MNGQTQPQDPAYKSPWISPPSEAPKRSTAIVILLLGFLLLIGALIYNLQSILSGNGFPFVVFLALLIVSTVLIIIGARMFAKSYASRKYAQIMEQKKAYMAQAGMKTCPNCGKAIPQDSIVCPYCGTRL